MSNFTKKTAFPVSTTHKVNSTLALCSTFECTRGKLDLIIRSGWVYVKISSQKWTDLDIHPKSTLDTDRIMSRSVHKSDVIVQEADLIKCESIARLPWVYKTGYLNRIYNIPKSDCKVAGSSNLTCRDDWKTRWRLHSVGLTSTGVSLPGQNIIH